MRRFKLKQVENYIALFRKITEAVFLELSAEGIAKANEYLQTCQQKAIELGEFIEGEEGLGHPTVTCLEEFCEAIYQVNEGILSEEGLAPEVAKVTLDNIINQIEASAAKDIAISKVVVFLPYKACMWDSLESVWRKKKEEENTETFVIPIPYFDKNPDGTVKEMVYEKDQYPKDVPVVSYEEFDFEAAQPDEIYIHNPYDDMNFVTSVHPFFFSDNLKRFTSKLVYIPYFVLAEPNPDDPEVVENLKHFALTKGVVNADEIILQSEAMKKVYVEALVGHFGEETRQVWETKIKGTGSPKFDKILAMKDQEIEVPKDWLKIIEKPDGTRKKIVFYNIGVVPMINAEDKMVDKIEDVLKIFKENKDDVALLWRPHPLMISTMESMMPELAKRYISIVEKYKAEGWGIYDDTPDMDRSIVISDAYYGDQSSIVQLYEKLEKPIMIQNPEILNAL